MHDHTGQFIHFITPTRRNTRADVQFGWEVEYRVHLGMKSSSFIHFGDGSCILIKLKSLQLEAENLWKPFDGDGTHCIFSCAGESANSVESSQVLWREVEMEGVFERGEG